jgi:hypothetical protein
MSDPRASLRLGSEPAFPCDETSGGGASHAFGITHLGMSKREYLAALMLQGMLSADVVGDRNLADHIGWAKTAVRFADALLLELAE